MNTKSNKSQMKKEHKIASETVGYEEKYNDVMLNDVTFEELKREYGENSKKKKKFGFKSKRSKKEFTKSDNIKEKEVCLDENNDKFNDSDDFSKKRKNLSKKLFVKKNTNKSRKNSIVEKEIPIEDVNVEEEQLKRSENLSLDSSDDLIESDDIV